MKIYSYRNQIPSIHKKSFIAHGAVIIGDCRINSGANIWFNSVLRADVNTIHIGENTNIQDLSMLHVTEELPLVIENNVTVGHSVTLHACKVGEGSLIGMGATILDGAVIGPNCLVAAGSTVAPGKVYPAGSFIMGTPAKLIRELNEEEIEKYSQHYKSYIDYAQDFMDESVVKILNS